MSLNQYHISKRKRILDILIGIVGAIISIPFLLIAVTIIRLFDGIKPIFRQERLGHKGEPFQMMKLKTLQVTETNEMINPEVVREKMKYPTTRTGSFWRKTSIDELPQFWQVLKGEMTLVGYRPLPVLYIPHLSKIEGIEEAFVSDYLESIGNLKPGLTSLSSVRGRVNIEMQEKMRMDLKYAKEANLWTDLRIIILTAIFVLIQRDAA